MTKVTFKNFRGVTLAGNLYHADSGKIIVMAHGFTGDKSMDGRFDRIAELLQAAGYAVLSFDFSGCGESEDDSLTLEKEVDDLRSAIGFVRSRGYGRVALFGQSLGTLICLRCAGDGIATMVLVGAATDSMKYLWDKFYSPEQMRELGEKGCITDAGASPLRKQVVIDRQMLLDFESVNQEELLGNVRCPVLIIHGNNEADEEERQLLERSPARDAVSSGRFPAGGHRGRGPSFLRPFGPRD